MYVLLIEVLKNYKHSSGGMGLLNDRLEVTKVCSGHSLKLQVRMSWMSTVSQEVKLKWKELVASTLGADLDCLSKLVM